MSQNHEERVRRIEELVRRLEIITHPECREIAHDLMEAVLELHGAALERMMEIIFDTGENGGASIRKLAGDELVGSVLILHGLHPDEMETRVRHAVAKLNSSVELIGIFEGVVRVRVSGGESKELVEAAIREAAPDAAGIVVEEIGLQAGFVPLASLASALPGGVI